MHWKNICGLLAGTLTTVSFVPQLLKVVRTQSTRDVSLGMFLIFSFGVTLWLLYGILEYDIPIILSNAVTLVLATTILILKLKYD